MIPPGLLVHTVTIVTPVLATANAYGDRVPDYGAGATRRTIKARIQQDTRSEDATVQRDPTRQTWTMFTNDTAVTFTDRVEWTGPAGALVFDFDGPPEPAYAGDGTVHHTEATLIVRAG